MALDHQVKIRPKPLSCLNRSRIDEVILTKKKLDRWKECYLKRKWIDEKNVAEIKAGLIKDILPKKKLERLKERFLTQTETDDRILSNVSLANSLLVGFL